MGKDTGVSRSKVPPANFDMKTADFPYVQDDRLGGNLHDIVNGTHAAGHVHQLDVRLALGGGVAQGGHPHAVELPGLALLIDHGFFRNQPGDARVRLDDGQKGLHLQ